MSAPRQRQRRANEAIREVVGSALLVDLADPRLQMVTITSVETTPDLGRAKVYWTVLDPKRVGDAAAALESSRGVLQGKVARAIKSRQTPHLVFVHDELQDEARRLTALIDEVAPDGPLPEEPAG
ncbi:MAG: 30S ribosome-binding factor RbfA [Thermoleophilia bacterium]|jgi:ribosome-binding factor A|nr:30S ribosome-binding factor RbfA [Thermoleophilia bacterium]